jgi:orotidine-5'-phosphate decarboxylase
MARFANPIAAALDTSDLAQALKLAQSLKNDVGLFKLGMEFFFANGATGYAAVARHGAPIFLDLKLHDIPNTVVQALNSLMMLEPRPAIVNVHASGGQIMMEAAKAAIAGRTLLIAVTVLTSLADEDLKSIGFSETIDCSGHSLALARLAKAAGLDGVVCSALDVATIKRELGADFLTVVPGVRPRAASTGDQKRVATPYEARRAGADILVIGRPITRAPDPRAAARTIAKEIADAG